MEMREEPEWVHLYRNHLRLEWNLCLPEGGVGSWLGRAIGGS